MKEEKAKREATASEMTERFEDILAKEKEAYVKHSDIKEACKAKRFNMLIVENEKELKLENKKVVLEEEKVQTAAYLEEAKMLALKMSDLDDYGRMIM
ncbi:hypothetical protein D1007_04841 [Hordeum vulgare]|nr:hypothetical protein D1007_04841 [Hordeum vulgare]